MIWDPLVRVTHWLIAALFLCNFWLLEAGEDWHEWTGYLLLGVLLVRLVWGFSGPKNARFSDFFPTLERLSQAKTHWVDDLKSHQGHSAIAGLMILFLWSGLLLCGVSGWLQETDAFWGEDWVELLHYWSANLVMAAVAVHVSVVVFLQWKYRVALVRSMIRGR